MKFEIIVGARCGQVARRVYEECKTKVGQYFVWDDLSMSEYELVQLHFYRIVSCSGKCLSSFLRTTLIGANPNKVVYIYSCIMWMLEIDDFQWVLIIKDDVMG